MQYFSRHSKRFGTGSSKMLKQESAESTGWFIVRMSAGLCYVAFVMLWLFALSN